MVVLWTQWRQNTAKALFPNTIKYWGLEPIREMAQETAEFVHLYSQTRGLKRFDLLVRVFEILEKRTDFPLRNIQPVREFTENTEYDTSLVTLLEFRKKNPSPELDTLLEWTKAIDRDVKTITGVEAFDGVEESLKFLQDKADLIVVSVTPTQQLQNEWAEHNLSHYIRLITGQEMGSKTDRIQQAMTGKYPPERVLMMGDSPGDLRAAQENSVLFYPILAGKEVDSWTAFRQDGVYKFLEGKFDVAYQQKLINEFNENLPEVWEG